MDIAVLILILGTTLLGLLANGYFIFKIFIKELQDNKK